MTPRRLFSRLITVISLVLVSAFAIVEGTASSFDMAKYRASERNREAMENYLGPVLTPLGGAGRFYSVVDCGPNECPDFPRIRMQSPSEGKTGFAAVREIFAKDKQTTVTSGPKGIVRIRFGRDPSALLQTTIHYLRFTPLQRYNIIEAEAAIEDAKEVKAATRKLRLERSIVVISELVQKPMKGVHHLPEHIQDMTVDQALDLLATTFGEVMLYQECIRPNGTRCYLINHAYVQGGKWLEARRAHWDKMRTDGFNSGICPVHRVPLQETVVYGWSHSDDEPIDPRPQDLYFSREEKYPMRLSVYQRLRPSRDYQERRVYKFCPICQRLFEADLQHFSSNRAPQPAVGGRRK